MEASAGKFKVNIIKWLDLIGNTLNDLRDEELTERDSTSMKAAIAIVELMKSEVLIHHFIRGHAHWDMIAKRDLKFVTEEIPKIYGKEAIDVDSITEPPKIYLKLQKDGYKGSKKEADWPINSEDINQQWKLFDAFAVLACRYIKARLTHPPKVLEEIDSIIKQIDLPKYEKLFKV